MTLSLFLRAHQMPNTVYEQCIKTHPLWLGIYRRRICDIKESLLVFWDCPKKILKSECHKVTKAYLLINWRLEVFKFEVVVTFVSLEDSFIGLSMAVFLNSHGMLSLLCFLNKHTCVVAQLFALT